MDGVRYTLTTTTQGPLYPPSEIVDAQGNFVVVGRIPQADGSLPWGGAIVSAGTAPPRFGDAGRYDLLRWFDLDDPGELSDLVLHTLPLPLPCNNYPMLFAPEQRPQAHREQRASFPLHRAPVPDLREEDGRRALAPVTLGNWLKARGELEVIVAADARSALFQFSFRRLVPDSVYTVMSLRQRDLAPEGPTRPGPLGVPNVFVTDANGDATYWARLPNPFPDPALPTSNRIINVVVLFMSSQMSHGGAIGWYGLGGDIHAHLKFQSAAFGDLLTRA